MKKSELRKIIREEIQKLNEASLKLTKFKDSNNNNVYIFPVKFSGSIEKDIKMLRKNEDYDNFLYSKLDNNEGVTDKNKKIIYWGADIQDFLK